MPLTYFEEDVDNLVAQVFWGRVYLEQAVSWFYFSKGSKYQSAIHKLKYQGRNDIAVYLGQEFGYQLGRATSFQIPDVLIPVPLHPKKMKKRGYNQSEEIAKGLSEALNIPLLSKVLLKSDNTKTQTNLSRFDRYLNVSESFTLNYIELIENKHIFLIDDVLTTGATLEACASKLLEIEGVKVSAGTLAWARD